MFPRSVGSLGRTRVRLNAPHLAEREFGWGGPGLTGPVPRVISGRLRPHREPGANRYDFGAACHNLLHHQIAGQKSSPGWPHGDRRHPSWWPLGGRFMARARLVRAGRGLGWRGLVAGSALALATAAAGTAAAPPAQAGVGTAVGSGTAVGGGGGDGGGGGGGGGGGAPGGEPGAPRRRPPARRAAR